MNTKENIAVAETSSVERGVYIIIFVTSVVCILIGLILQMSHEKEPPTYWGHLFELFSSELGVAGLISLFIIGTIEKFTRSKHEAAADKLVDRIKTNLFYAIYQRHIPQEVFTEVERCLLTANIIRRNYSICYDLDIIPDEMAKTAGISDLDKNSHLLCDISVTYELENISNGLTIAPIDMNLELPIDNNMSKLVGVDSLSIDGKHINIPTPCKTTNSHCEFHHEINLPSMSKAKIRLQGRTVKRKTDMEVWSSRIPSDGLTLEISAPDSIKINAKANHSTALNYVRNNSGKRHRWELEGGIFPFQSVIFWWKAE